MLFMVRKTELFIVEFSVNVPNRHLGDLRITERGRYRTNEPNLRINLT